LIQLSADGNKRIFHKGKAEIEAMFDFHSWQKRSNQATSFQAMQYTHEMKNVHIEINDLVLNSQLDCPPDKPFAFVYFLSIHNYSEHPVTVLGRKWLVQESDQELIVVEGEGVVGEKPCILPNEHFSYHSYHVVARRAQVKGTLFLINEKGEHGFVIIPPFELVPPNIF
jgi:ApaG protein